MKFDKNNIMMIEFDKFYPNDYKITMVALYNKTKITDKEARKAIKTYGIGESPNVIIITKKQYENVFMNENMGVCDNDDK